MADQPDIMAVGDSMYQGVRSLSFTPKQAPFSPPAQVARALGMRMILPDLQHPLLFDMEVELRHGGVLSLITHIRDVCLQNLAFWEIGKPWSVHAAFDNVAVGGATIDALYTDTYDMHLEELPGLISQLNDHNISTQALAAAIGDLWYTLNYCYTLNPCHLPAQASKTQVQQAIERQPRYLLVNIGSNEGLFMAGFTGDLTVDAASYLSKVQNLADQLKRMTSRTEKIVFNSLVRPRFIPNLMPGPEHEMEFPGLEYYPAYGPRIYSTQQHISGEQMAAFDGTIRKLNQDAAGILKGTVGDRLIFADLYAEGDAIDGKHYQGGGLMVSAGGHEKPLNNKPITPLLFGGYYGGLAGLDNMHPTVPGYAFIADTVLAAFGSAARTDKSAAFTNDTLLTSFAGFPTLIAQMELSLLGTFGAFRGKPAVTADTIVSNPPGVSGNA